MGDVSLAVCQPSRDYVSDGDQDIAARLSQIIDGEVRFGRHDRMLYSTDASMYQVEPIGVAVPRSKTDLIKIIEFARDHQLAILPRGGGTSLAGQCVNKALVIDASKYLRKVTHIDEAANRCTVEPGVVLDQLNASLSCTGLMFGPDVATSTHATIAGMIGNNSAGARSILYGRTVENVARIECVLADGRVLRLDEGAASREADVADITREVVAIVSSVADEIRDRYPRTMRNSGGYLLDGILRQIEQSSPGEFDRVNLSHLLCGSEGTLAVTLEATVNLVQAPRAKGLAIVSFGSVEEALALLGRILVLKPSAVELLDEVVIDMARRNIECSRYVDMLPRSGSEVVRSVLYVEFHDDSERVVNKRLSTLRGIVSPHPFDQFTDAESMTDAWKLRKSGEPLLHAIPGARKPIAFIEDTAVDPLRLGQFVGEFKQIVSGYGTRAAYWAHASVGCLHVRPMIDLKDQNDRELMPAIARDVVELVKKYGGAFSGEHGDGRARSHLLEQFYGKRILAAFREIKMLFDPENRLNPGNIVGPPEMMDHLRVQPIPSAQVIGIEPVETFFRYEHGFGQAIEACNGAGICRRRSGGTMCPSYRATLDERHATRGRGNALRLAITGQLGGGYGRPSWSDEETIRTLDLCLSCKACKSECPTNVDMAKLKSEYTAQRYAHTGTPLSARLIGNVRMLNHMASMVPSVANTLARFPLSRAAINRLMKIDRRRSLPRIATSLFRQARHRSDDRSRPTVLLFTDCFTTYNEPHVGLAAIRVLNAFGYRTVLSRAGCCGRSMISMGLLERASATCANTARTLHAEIEANDAVAVLVLEPSCLSAIIDDWSDLRMDVSHDIVNAVRDKAMLIETFIESRWLGHPETPAFEESNGSRVLLHGHCHQKALWGTASTVALLKRVRGEDRVEVLDSGCCGMAGSFGFSSNHYDLSMAIGELSLFPAIRENPNADIAAPGTSCRHQIYDGLKRVAKHPIEIIAAALSG